MGHLELQALPVSGVEPRPQALDKELRRFFVCVASILAVIAAIRFAPSFYLRDVISATFPSGRDLPAYLTATLWGVASYLVVGGVSIALAASELGHRLVKALV